MWGRSPLCSTKISCFFSHLRILVQKATFSLYKIFEFFFFFFYDSNKVFCFKWADGNKARVRLEGSSLINNGKGREDGSSLISHEKGREKSGSQLLFPAQCAALFRLERSEGLRLLKLLNKSPSTSRYNTETRLHGPVTAPRTQSVFQTVSFIILCLSYSLTLPVFFLKKIHLSTSLSPVSSLSRWGPSISQTCYYNPNLSASHPEALKVWLAQYDGETGKRKKKEWSKRQKWEKGEGKKRQERNVKGWERQMEKCII